MLAAQAAPERISEAVSRLRTAERRQVEWRPVSLVPDDHRVRSGKNKSGPPQGKATRKRKGNKAWRKNHAPRPRTQRHER